MSTNYKTFKNLKQMVNQPASKHWFAREKLTKEKGFNAEHRNKAKALQNKQK